MSEEQPLNQEKIKEEIKNRLETSELSEILERIDHLMEEEKEIEVHHVGMKVALIMANELKEGKALGEDSGKELLNWKGYFSEDEMNEVVACARQYLLTPEKLAESLSKRLFEGEE